MEVKVDDPLTTAVDEGDPFFELIEPGVNSYSDIPFVSGGTGLVFTYATFLKQTPKDGCEILCSFKVDSC